MKNHQNGFSYNGIDRNKDDFSFFDYSIIKRDMFTWNGRMKKAESRGRVSALLSALCNTFYSSQHTSPPKLADKLA